MIEKFKTLLVVKSSLISLYLALTIPLPFISINNLKIFSVILTLSGLFLIFGITSDHVETCNSKISYKTNFISKILGRENWEIYWKDIKEIISFPTSQGSKVYYFKTKNDNNYLIPQRIEDFGKFLSIVSDNTDINTKQINYISPLWTYKLLTLLSVFMIFGELFSFLS